jgi:ribosomal protein S18 acetylase RimI-like enzyme
MTAIRVLDEEDPDVVGRLADELSSFNFAATGIHDGRWLFAAVRDDAGEVRGAIQGWTWGGSGWIERLWVREADRGVGLGSALLTAAIEEVRARGCTQVGLTTHSFQAPDFYRRHGFTVAGEIPGYPAGHAYFLMRLVLT